MITEKQMEIFERAFSGGMGSCRMTCVCGKIYFHDDAHGYDWDAGELEDLRKRGASAGGSVSNVRFEGIDYVNACTCWHDRAKKIMGFIDGHAPQIASYLNAMKKQRQIEAENSPVVEV